MDLTDIEVELTRLDITPNSVLVIKSDDVDPETIARVRELLAKHNLPPILVMGVGSDDDIAVLPEVRFTDTLIVRSNDMVHRSTEEERKMVSDMVKQKTGCQAVLFVDDNTTVEKLPQSHLRVASHLCLNCKQSFELPGQCPNCVKG